jgi:hypothetical protein
MEEDSGPEARIVANLRHTLEQLKVSSGKSESYMRLVESVVVGPASIRHSDIEHLLGINSDLYSRARARRQAVIKRTY